ncbi:MAG TPA: glycosyltransferase, partial [Chthoniobacterales bacterium]
MPEPVRASRDLPVSVVIPTRNCAAAFERHWAALESWAPRCREIVFVDSESSDGTLELVRKAAGSRANAVILSHPPGLYASWNAAIARCSADFTCIATVGDCVAPDGLAHLVETAERLGCDALLSPPGMRTGEGGPSAGRWPIHELAEARCP